MIFIHQIERPSDEVQALFLELSRALRKLGVEFAYTQQGNWDECHVEVARYINGREWGI